MLKIKSEIGREPKLDKLRRWSRLLFCVANLSDVAVRRYFHSIDVLLAL